MMMMMMMMMMKNVLDYTGSEKCRKSNQLAGTRSDDPVRGCRVTGVFVSAGVVVDGADRTERLLRRRMAAEFFYGVASSAILVWLKLVSLSSLFLVTVMAVFVVVPFLSDAMVFLLLAASGRPPVSVVVLIALLFVASVAWSFVVLLNDARGDVLCKVLMPTVLPGAFVCRGALAGVGGSVRLVE